MPKPTPESVDAYLASLDAPHRELMSANLDFALAEFPGTTPTIAWKKPHVKLGNDYVLGLEALTHHLFFHPFSEKIITDFAPRLTDYKTGKRSLQIPLGWELDTELLRDILSARIAEVS
jgi:uncharacterized protein YdhG (YjbR/CyaY superfamily)